MAVTRNKKKGKKQKKKKKKEEKEEEEEEERRDLPMVSRSPRAAAAAQARALETNACTLSTTVGSREYLL